VCSGGLGGVCRRCRNRVGGCGFGSQCSGCIGWDCRGFYLSGVVVLVGGGGMVRVVTASSHLNEMGVYLFVTPWVSLLVLVSVTVLIFYKIIYKK